MSLTINYHMHTTRCGHASGSDRDFVEKAIQCGYSEIGFSDHTPYPFPEHHNPHLRMTSDKLEGYVTSVLNLREEYQSDIRIYLALEAEYYPGFFDKWLHMVEPYPFDYFILGQHFVGNDYPETYTGTATDDETILKKYVDQTIEGLKTGTYIYLAHPDLIRFNDTHSDVYHEQMQKLCESAKELSIPLEINLLGIADRRWYPNPIFWEIAGSVGNDVIIGADAHKPSALDNQKEVDAAKSIISKNQLHLIQKLSF